ncbi:MAG TPA: DEAD/DEAH box helicase [Propionibacteriaceae bacterium]
MDLNLMLDDEHLVANLGGETVARGSRYARDGHVNHLEFDEHLLEVQAEVEGSRHHRYQVKVELNRFPPFDHVGSCTCPMSFDCKHVVATLITLRRSRNLLHGLGLGSKGGVEPPTPSPPQTGTKKARVTGPRWEADLNALLGRAKATDPVGEPLGLRVEALVGRTVSRLQCRPVRRSPSTGRWVQTGAAWQDVMYDFRRQFVPAHIQLLKRLRHAAVDVASGTYYGGYAGSPWLPLDGAEENLWPILHQLVGSGVTLVGTTDRDSVVIADHALEVVVDVANGQAGGLQVRPVLKQAGGEVPVGPFVLIGEPGHGLARITEGHGRKTLELNRLTRPVEPALARWLTAGNTVAVPANDRDRFLQTFYPNLRREAVVVSLDDSVDLPTPVAPVIRLTVHHPAAEQLELRWAVGYGVAGVGTEFPLGDHHGGEVRDSAAEQALWTELAPILHRAPPEVLDPVNPSRPRVRGLLAGLAAAEFASERLAELEAAGVEVSHSGERTDYRRAEGAPQVVVSTDERPGGSDWFDLTISVSINDEPVPFVLLFRALAEGAGHLILPSGLYFSLAQPEFHQLAELIGEARALQDRERTTLRIHVHQAGLWEELTRLGVVGRQAARWQTRVADLAQRGAPTEIAPPVGLRADLRPYQLEGFAWLYRLWELGLGGILADDMGLGKTLQALALIVKIREEQQQGSRPGSGPFLVVAPTSVSATWLTEAARFTPGLKVVVVQQTEAKRATSLAELAAGADVVITSYTLARLDAEAYHALQWQGLILDEAQFVKNYQAKTYASLRKLDVDFTIAMTGTPLENSLMDLWAMLSLTAPGMFPSPDRFSEYFRRPIERNTRPERLDRLRDRVRPVMLRRTKEQVATELPPKQEQVISVDLHPSHARIYQRQLQRERQKILGLIGDLDSNRFTILRSLTLLRQLSLDAALVDPEHEGVPSAKVDLLVEMMTELVAEGHRALVFSQFTTFLKRVGDRLTQAGVEYAYLDGRTRNRARVIEGFKSGTSGAFLISLKAGGFGLNLTEADYCFVLDPWWNPASEAQAVDRAHRIGQERPVMVYRLVSKNTIEDKVMELKSKKQQLFDQVMSADGLPSGAFTPAEIRSLLAG